MTASTAIFGGKLGDEESSSNSDGEESAANTKDNKEGASHVWNKPQKKNQGCCIKNVESKLFATADADDGVEKVLKRKKEADGGEKDDGERKQDEVEDGFLSGARKLSDEEDDSHPWGSGKKFQLYAVG